MVHLHKETEVIFERAVVILKRPVAMFKRTRASFSSARGYPSASEPRIKYLDWQARDRTDANWTASCLRAEGINMNNCDH